MENYRKQNKWKSINIFLNVIKKNKTHKVFNTKQQKGIKKKTKKPSKKESKTSNDKLQKKQKLQTTNYINLNFFFFLVMK